jgi:hypothetical protein
LDEVRRAAEIHYDAADDLNGLEAGSNCRVHSERPRGKTKFFETGTLIGEESTKGLEFLWTKKDLLSGDGEVNKLKSVANSVGKWIATDYS